MSVRYRPDATWRRVGPQRRVLLAGSPLRLYRLTGAGGSMLDRVERGEAVAGPLVERLVDAGAIHPLPTGAAGFGPDDVTIVTPQLGGSVRPDRDVTVDDASSPALEGASLRLASNRGPAAARNAGRRLVDTPLVAFVDADVDLPFDRSDSDGRRAWWAPLLALFDDPRVGLVAPRVTGDRGSSLDLGPAPARIRAGSRVSYVPAAAIVVRATAFDDIGGFDEQMRAGEDVDFVWRLDQAGWRCRFEPASNAVHRRRATWRARIRQQVVYGASSAPLALRHPRALAPLRTSGWTAATLLSALCGRPRTALVAFGLGVAASMRRLPSIPARTTLELAVYAQWHAVRQLTEAVRRSWWPMLAVAALGSRRARRLVLASTAAAPHRIVADVSFGWGLWTGVVRHREWRPLAPRLVPDS